MPTFCRSSSSLRVVMTFSSSSSTLPVARELGTRSYMRLKTRRRVLLPQPDGPMMAVIRLSGMSNVTLLSAWNLP